MKDFEEVTAFLGDWGCFQKVVLFLLLSSTIPNGLGFVSVVFISAVPKHQCKIPEVNLTQNWLSVIIPVKVVNGKQELSSCSRYNLDVIRNLSAEGLLPGIDVNVTDLEEESCLDGWIYSKEIYQSTIVSEFDLVCDDEWKQPLSPTVYFLGVLMGSFFAGQLADRYGRKPVFFTTMAVQTVFTVVLIFSPSWIVFAIMFFISGMGQMANYVAAFVLGTEILSGKIRILFSTLGVALGYTIGSLLVPLIAYFLRDWKKVFLATSLPALIYILLWWFIPESPRWLVSQGRLEEAEAIIRKAAKMNKVEAPEDIFAGYNAKSKGEAQPNALDLILNKKMRPITPILCLLWFTVLTAYYGLTLNSGNLTADPYLSTFISVAVELPAYVCVWLVTQKLPRRPSLICMILLGGLSLFFTQLVPETLPELAIALEMLGKYGFTSGATLLFPYTAEIYPTVIRSTAAGTCSIFPRIGTCIAPFLFQTRPNLKYLPHVLLGTLSLVCAFITVFLPETFGKPLPETIEDMSERTSSKPVRNFIFLQ
uniref:Major facilitator superfamily (MFS) profile domain-containing protein n=1 Tax=Tetraodon nigroviridis TaxID=99883 RepID=H3C2Y4_TETNG